MEGELRKRVRSSLRRTVEIASFNQSLTWTSLTTNLLPVANHHHTQHQHHRLGLPHTVKNCPFTLRYFFFLTEIFIQLQSTAATKATNVSSALFKQDSLARQSEKQPQQQQQGRSGNTAQSFLSGPKENTPTVVNLQSKTLLADSRGELYTAREDSSWYQQTGRDASGGWGQQRITGTSLQQKTTKQRHV